jgi:hypothetical protein
MTRGFIRFAFIRFECWFRRWWIRRWRNRRWGWLRCIRRGRNRVGCSRLGCYGRLLCAVRCTGRSRWTKGIFLRRSCRCASIKARPCRRGGPTYACWRFAVIKVSNNFRYSGCHQRFHGGYQFFNRNGVGFSTIDLHIQRSKITKIGRLRGEGIDECEGGS